MSDALDNARALEVIAEYVSYSFARIEGEWGRGLSIESALAAGDEEAVELKEALTVLRSLVAEHERIRSHPLLATVDMDASVTLEVDESAAPPADDERGTPVEGVARAVRDWFAEVSEAAGFRRQVPVTVTDETAERMTRIHDLLSSLDLDSSITREGTAWGSILREALALSEADARATLSPDGNTRRTDGSTT